MTHSVTIRPLASSKLYSEMFANIECRDHIQGGLYLFKLQNHWGKLNECVESLTNCLNHDTLREVSATSCCRIIEGNLMNRKRVLLVIMNMNGELLSKLARFYTKRS